MINYIKNLIQIDEKWEGWKIISFPIFVCILKYEKKKYLLIVLMFGVVICVVTLNISDIFIKDAKKLESDSFIPNDVGKNPLGVKTIIYLE